MYAKEAKSRIMKDIRDLVAIMFLVNRPGSKYIKNTIMIEHRSALEMIY